MSPRLPLRSASDSGYLHLPSLGHSHSTRSKPLTRHVPTFRLRHLLLIFLAIMCVFLYAAKVYSQEAAPLIRSGVYQEIGDVTAGDYRFLDFRMAVDREWCDRTVCVPNWVAEIRQLPFTSPFYVVQFVWSVELRTIHPLGLLSDA